MSLIDRVRGSLGLTKSTNNDANSINDIVDELDRAQGEKEKYGFLRSKVDEVRASASRIAHESVWMQNCAYTVGFAGIFFNTTTRTFMPVNRSGASLRKNRLYVNKILPNLQNRLAKLTKNPPRFDVRPNDNTQEAKDNARFKLDILTAKWDELKINLERQQLLMWVQECGHAYAHVCWDDNKGKIIQDPETGEPMFEGDIRFETVSPFEIFPDPLAKSFDESEYFIRAKIRPLAYFRNRYGEKGAQVKEEETWLLSLQYDTRVNTMNTRGFSSSTGQASQRNTAIELTYWEKPSLKHPRGRMLVGASGVLLDEKDLPTGKIPLVKFDDIVVAGKYYSEAVVTHVRPIQDQYNQVLRRRADWVNKMLAGKYISPRGNELIREALTDESAEIIQYTPVPNAPGGGEPKHMDIPMIPQYAYNEEDKLDQQFSEVMGISEVSKGQLPSASIPALGMQILVEADDTRIGVEVYNHESGYSQIGQHILDYVQQYYQVPRKMKFAGENALVIKEVAGEMLEGDNDVMVIPGSTIPGSKALRRQEILNAYGQGLLGDPQDPVVRQNVLGMLELGEVGEVFIDNSLDKHRVKSEIEAIEQGVLPDVAEEFNHAFMLKELARFRKSEKFDGLPDESKMIYEAVKEEHIRFLGELTGSNPAGLSEMEEAQGIDQQAKAMDDTAQASGAMQDEQLPMEQKPQAEPPVGGGGF